MTTTTPKKTNILDVLGISYMVYDNYRERQFQIYCSALAEQYFMSYKLLHTNDWMQNYFHDMWQIHVEQSFLRDNVDYFDMCEPKLLRGLFQEYTRNVIDGGKVQMYPLSLLKVIRNRNLQKTAN